MSAAVTLAALLAKSLDEEGLDLVRRAGPTDAPLTPDARRDVLSALATSLANWTLIRDVVEWEAFTSELRDRDLKMEPASLPPNPPFLLQQTERGFGEAVSFTFVQLVAHDIARAHAELWAAEGGHPDEHAKEPRGVLESNYGVWVAYRPGREL